ncbi:hypothetical protein ACFTZI_20600 [Streptomyces decoyicus]|uniref:hypothetical protein n=1 Tax=Streptomyces decoyicus TaxID=249567 RepID=UPI00362C0C09
MIETRKQYGTDNVEVTVVYDDQPGSLTYVLATIEESTSEFNLTPTDLAGLTSILNEAQSAKFHASLSF